MNWTTPADIRIQALRLWDKGKILASLVNRETLFPYRLALKSPKSAEFSGNFAAARAWIDDLQQGEKRGYRIVWKEIDHRLLGRNRVPGEIWIDSFESALALIGKKNETLIFKRILDETGRRLPALLPWLERRPLRALEAAGIWTHVLDVLIWVRNHPRSGLYLRQVDIPGLNTKFIERNRGLLSDLLDATLPPEAICSPSSGVSGFCRRYGFRDKAPRIRFRVLDPRQAIFPCGDQDITVTEETFSSLNLNNRRVFITENETNFLALPPAPNSLAVFGAGYGFESLASAHWLHECTIHYWGDIDTHGFAILDQLRAAFPHAQSLLMDRDTLMQHRAHWVQEPKPQKHDLPRLTDPESRLYDDLRYDRLGPSIRLEQELIGFSWVEQALKRLYNPTARS